MALIMPFAGRRPRIAETAFLAPGAVIVGDVDIGPRTSIWFGAVIRGDNAQHGIRIGAETNIQDNAVVHVSGTGPTVLEDEVTVGHGALLDSCRIGRRTVVGMGATVLQGAEVAHDCLIAAGAVVKEDARIAPGRMVAGVPGRVRPISERARAWTAGSAAHYAALARRYLKEVGCDLCNGPVLERHCKIVCLNCGFQRDCSDP